MARETRRPPLTGSAFIRSLAALDDAQVAASTDDAFADRLSRWFAWTDAIALAGVLAGSAPVPQPAPPSRGHAVAAEEDFERVRASLVALVLSDDDDSPFPASKRMTPPPVAGATETFPPHRLRYQTRQQAMEAGIAPLRRRVRAALAAASPALARLAALDEVMEQAVGPKAHALLMARVPLSLERHFRRLRPAAPASSEDGDAPVAALGPTAWLDGFCRDVKTLLLAELDFRLQPVEGLLEALRNRPPPTDPQ